MEIGSISFDPVRPADLDEITAAAFGCNTVEIGGLLRGIPLAGMVARAVSPFIPEADRPDEIVIAQEIAAAGVIPIARAVAELYEAQDDE